VALLALRAGLRGCEFVCAAAAAFGAKVDRKVALL